MFGFPQELNNRIIIYTRFPTYLDELQQIVIRRNWRHLSENENSYNIAKWNTLPIYIRYRFWYRFVMYNLILKKIVGVRIHIIGEYITLEVVDRYDFDECLEILKSKLIDIDIIENSTICIAGIRFHINN